MAGQSKSRFRPNLGADVVGGAVLALCLLAALGALTISRGNDAGYPLRLQLPEPVAVHSDRFALIDFDDPERYASDIALLIAEADASLHKPNQMIVATAPSHGPPREPIRRLAQVKQPLTEVAGAVPVRFDLAAGAQPRADAFELRKRLVANGKPSGTVRIAVDGSDQPFVSRADVSAFFDRGGGKTPSGLASISGDFVSFERLRAVGLDIRYDPVSDRILIANP